MRVVASLLPMKVHTGIARILCRLAFLFPLCLLRILPLKALQACPRFQQRSVHREMLVAEQILVPRLLQHSLEKLLRHLPFQQTDPGSWRIPSHPTPHRPYSCPRTNGTAGYSPTAPSAVSHCAPCTTPAAITPATTSPGQSRGGPSWHTSHQTGATSPPALDPSSPVWTVKDGWLVLVVPGKDSYTSLLVESHRHA